MNYVIIATLAVFFGLMGLPQLNSANQNNRQMPMVTESTLPNKVHLDIDHSSKGNVTAECDKNPDTVVLDSDPDRPKTKVTYHNCTLMYDVE